MTNAEQPDRIRASDADREQVAQILGEAHAEGRLTAEEFSERLDRLYLSKTHGDLVPLSADLAVGETASSQRRQQALVPQEHLGTQLALLSTTEARPTGRVAGQLKTVSLLGNAQLDLSHAVIDPGGVVITARALLGAVNITVPADARVSMTGLPLAGSLSPTREPGPVDGPRVVVKAFAGMGSVTIHRAEAVQE